MRQWSLRFIGVSSALLSTAASIAPVLAQTSLELGELVVTATGRPEPRSRITSTVQVIGGRPPAARQPAESTTTPQPDEGTGSGQPGSGSGNSRSGQAQIIGRSEIELSTAKSVTELLVENSVGFLGQWTPDQTQIVIRGATTEPQGRDFKGEVLVLINGHRAGTGNISKLSLADVDRIEIVRGPASVVYGSQNMGGVVNIIMKTGRTGSGTFVEASAGSWGLAQGKAQTGGVKDKFDWYFGSSGGTQSDYHVGGGAVDANTAWHRRGFTASGGYQINPDNHIGVNLRTDGIYDAGFRGSASSIFSQDDRFNRSFDVNYEGGIPGGRVSWFFQTYGVTDVDDLNNPSPLATISNVNPINGTTTAKAKTSVDRNTRQLDIVGTRFQPRVKMWTTNDLLVGWDWERSWIRSIHNQANLAGVTTLVAPSDNNQTENVNAYYFEDAQTFFDDRWTVRGGMRWTYGTTSLDSTPGVVGLIPGTTPYQATTYSVGTSWRALDWLTFRAGTSTGFRAPTATELGANFTQATSGSKTFGNPGLRPESSKQYEAGANIVWNAFQFDVAVFQNVIHDRIKAQARPAPNPGNISDTINNPGDIIMQGVEVQTQVDMIKMLKVSKTPWIWSVFSSGLYNFKMVDLGAKADVLGHFDDHPTRVSQYDLTLGTRFGQGGSGIPFRDWTLKLVGILRGPMWYNTEEVLNQLYYPGQDRQNTIYKKDAFWVYNARYDTLLGKGWTGYIAINNILDINQHPTFIALNQVPCTLDQRAQNGACGNSMPGREFIVGVQARW